MGCDPTGIILTGNTPTPVQGDMGGTLYSDACPPGQVVIGYAGGLVYPFGHHNQMHALCGTLNLTGNGPYTITVTGETALPSHGGIGFAPWTSKCPANQMVVGFDGRAGSDLELLIVRCAGLTVTGSPGSYAISVGAATAQTGVGNPLGGNAFLTPTDCPGGQVATAAVIRAGSTVTALGLVCSKPELTY